MTPRQLALAVFAGMLLAPEPALAVKKELEVDFFKNNDKVKADGFSATLPQGGGWIYSWKGYYCSSRFVRARDDRRYFIINFSCVDTVPPQKLFDGDGGVAGVRSFTEAFQNGAKVPPVDPKNFPYFALKTVHGEGAKFCFKAGGNCAAATGLRDGATELKTGEPTQFDIGPVPAGNRSWQAAGAPWQVTLTNPDSATVHLIGLEVRIDNSMDPIHDDAFVPDGPSVGLTPTFTEQDLAPGDSVTFGFIGGNDSLAVSAAVSAVADSDTTMSMVALIEAQDDLTGVEGQPIGRTGISSVRCIPSPARGPVEIRFELGEEADVVATVCDVAGRVVWQWPRLRLQRGAQRLTWDGRATDGRRARDGVYFVRLRAPSHVTSGALVLVH